MSPQQTIAHYRITAKLGEGGMGEVWRATDTKLNRDVAIKFLPEAFAQDTDHMARFEREAKVLASLNHPNIAAIYGVEERALVMELVPGPTLAERIASGPIPLDEALPIARQIAEGLEYAHERGVIHRDLKPANIKITPEGKVKVLDFGLAAVAQASAGDAANPVSSPTLTMRATQLGVILGTAAYMSPEQAKGKPVDRRADIWAFGVVLDEMLSGRQLYTGDTVSETLAAVLMKEPDLSALPAATPTVIRTLLRRCLERDPQRRLQAIGEARIAIEQSPEEPPPAAAVAAATGSGFMVWVAAALALAVLALGFLLWRATRPTSHLMMSFSVDLGPEAMAGLRTTAVISPDGTRLVFPVRGPAGIPQLATRLLDQAKYTVLAGTEDAADPFFKPDGRWIGFFAENKLKKISVHGGAAVTLCDASIPRGAAWGQDGNILATLDALHISRVPEAGGTPEVIFKPEIHHQRTYRWPQILPGGQNILVTASAIGAGGSYEDANLEVLSLKTGQPKAVQRGGYFGRYLPSGHLIYVHQGTGFAVPFDLARLEIKGTPAPVFDDVAGVVNQGSGQLDFSQTGTLVYLSGKSSENSTTLTWLDSAGKTQPLVTTAGTAITPRFSPDGKRLAMAVLGDIYVYDPPRNAMTRLTFNGSFNRYPVWTQDGKHLIFGSGLNAAGEFGIQWIRADGASQPEPLFVSKEDLRPYSLTPDGRRLAFQQLGANAHNSIWTLPLDQSDPEHPKPGKPELYLQDAADNVDPALSPDGRWMAYASNEAGPYNVLVRPFPLGPSSGKWQISTTTGRYPVWSRNGRETFFLGPDNRIMVAGYTAKGESFASDKPRNWSETSIVRLAGAPSFDLAPDGKRFVVFPAQNPLGDSKSRVTVLLNFFDELGRRLP